MRHTSTPPDSQIRRLLIVDDSPIVRAGIRILLQSVENLVVCAEAATIDEALLAVRSAAPTVAIVDISVSRRLDDLEIVLRLLQEKPGLPILVFAEHSVPRFALRVLQAGAKGFLKKKEEPETLAEAICTILAGGIYISPGLRPRPIFQAVYGGDSRRALAVERLSPRETEVFRLMGAEHSTRDIAEQLQLSIKTVESHRAHITHKLDFEDSTSAAEFAGDWMILHQFPPIS